MTAREENAVYELSAAVNARMERLEARAAYLEFSVVCLYVLLAATVILFATKLP